ncbi:MAG: lysophospholipid acyltransferase family protein [Planctomycetota bacterium]
MAEPAGGEGGPAPLPRGLRADWPVSWQSVRGRRTGLLARLEQAAVRLALAGANALPAPLLAAVIAVLSRLAPLVDRRHARVARSFLVQALGPLPPAELARRVRGAYRHLLRVVADAERFRRRVPPEEVLDHFEQRWSDAAREVAAAGQGSLVLTGHVGNWEVSIAAAPWVGFDPFFAISKPPANRYLSADFQAARERQGIRLIPRRGAMALAPAILRAGGSIGMMLDQRARKRPVLAPFFGRPARCDRSAAVLLKRMRVPVVFAACYATEQPLRFRLELTEVIRPEEVRNARIVDIVARVNRVFEAMIRQAPEQYFWLHDRYRDTPAEYPPGEAPAAGEAGAEGRDGFAGPGTVSSSRPSPPGEGGARS